MFAIVPIPNKGFGWIATQDIPIGTRLFKDVPVSSPIKQPLSAILKDMSIDQLAKLDALSYHSHNIKDAKIDNNKNVNDIREHRIRNNVFQVGKWYKLYLVIARINHSCDSNAKLVNDCIVSKRKIVKGEEITITYAADLVRDLKDIKKRKAFLMSCWKFDCNCSKCCL
jgi:hypothetical protein